MIAAPGWAAGYRREWLTADIAAGLVIWSVVVPQAVAYAQIAGLSPEAGLMAAPGALLAYALLGTSRSLVVSATTATSALSAAAVGPLAHGDTARFAALSAALALVTAAVLVGAGLLRLGGFADLVSKPVLTGFLFGLGLTITIGQLPAVLGVAGGEGKFFERLGDLVGELGHVDGTTAAVGAVSIALLLALQRLAPALPATLVLLVLAISASALLGLSDHGVAVVGEIPTALPDPSLPDVSGTDLADLLPSAFGILVVSTEAVGVARSLASAHGYTVDANRDLVAMGGSNLLAGLSAGFVQSGGASQTAAADRAGGKTQLSSMLAAALIVLTGAFLSPLFTDLPQATLAAIVVVAVAGFYRFDELARFLRVRRSAIVLALVALLGVLALGVLPGLVITAGLSLVVVIQRISRPEIGELGRDRATGAWARADRHVGLEAADGVLVVRADGPIFYANAAMLKEWITAAALAAEPRPELVVIDMGAAADLDIAGLDALADLEVALGREQIELRLASVRARARELLRRDGLDERIPVFATLDAAARVEP